MAGIANSPVATSPAANTAAVHGPARGAGAEAAAPAVSTRTIPWAPRVAATVTMMKNATICESAMPT